MNDKASVKYSNRVLVADSKAAAMLGPEAITRAELKAATDLVDCLVVNSCFASETPDDDVFPSGMVEVTFDHCNLDNVLVPPGNVIYDDPADGGCTNKTIVLGDDGKDWITDKNGDPIAKASVE